MRKLEREMQELRHEKTQAVERNPRSELHITVDQVLTVLAQTRGWYPHPSQSAEHVFVTVSPDLDGGKDELASDQAEGRQVGGDAQPVVMDALLRKYGLHEDDLQVVVDQIESCKRARTSTRVFECTKTHSVGRQYRRPLRKRGGQGLYRDATVSGTAW